MIDNKYDIEFEGQGLIIRKDSYNEQVDESFVNQIATDDLTISDFSFFKAIQQDDFAGGFNHQKLDIANVFWRSNNVDIHFDNNEIRLSRQMSDNLETDALITEQVEEMISYGGKIYALSGDKVIVSVDGSEGSWSLSKDIGNQGYGLTIFNNYLFVWMGTNGYWRFDNTTWTQESNGTQAPAGQNEKIKLATLFTIGTTDYIYGIYENVLRRGTWNSGASRIDWTNVKTLIEDVSNFLTKPIVYNLNLYFFSKRASETLGPSRLWIHDGTDTLEVYNWPQTVGTRMAVYDNKMWFVLFGRDFTFFMNYNGEVFEESLRLDHETGGETYDSFTYTDVTASPSGSGTLYDQGLTSYSDPVYWAVLDERLIMTMRTSSSQNYLYEYSAKQPGWSQRNDFDLAPSATYALSMFNKQLFIGNDIGEIFSILNIYELSGDLETSLYDARVPMVNKLWTEVVLEIEEMRQGTDIQVYYDDEGSGFYTTLNMPTILGGETQIRIPISNTTATVLSKKIRLKIELTTTDGLRSPVIQDIIIRYAAMPEELTRWQYTVLCINGIELYDGTKELLTGAEILAFLRKEYSQKEVKTFKDIDYQTTQLDGAINSTTTTITVDSTAGFKSFGEGQLEDERFSYTSKTSTQFLGVTRGIRGTIATSHADNVALDNSWKVIFKDLSKLNHPLNAFDGEEALAQIKLYRA